ncbi:ubiquitin-associated and SH3 domain-containing protein B-like protein [Dinothrombium tinctorium]|uniref:Ubiquitin-associated and SH3 domain-containing protein B-like protein n=1 Tax=Dinothrombium tinctorium TaxID=1965070 RepID=A0A3S3NPT6_9ACAR|nr:ubiquitin-associated and SH3 domain-containing protein B-like protein [Dinothrombium tinctorium]
MKTTLIVMRHSVRLDCAHFNWLLDCFDKEGKIYTPKSEEDPETIVIRDRNEFIADTPLSVSGFDLAAEKGKELLETLGKIDAVFSSPALRCVETAKRIAIKIEPGLFEPLTYGLYRQFPQWLSPSLLQANGFPVDVNYEPIISVQSLQTEYPHESVVAYFARSKYVTEQILKRFVQAIPEGGKILLVAHASSLIANDPLNVEVPQTYNELKPKIRFCGFCNAKQIEIE